MNALGSDTLGRYKLLASAIAGRLVDVAPVEPGKPAWTDGATVFVDADANPRDRLRRVAVQASLLGAASLEPDVVARLRRRPALSRRYLAVEGHRALAAHEPLLPASAQSLIDRAVAARSDSPAGSLAVAASREAITDPPEAFGTIRPRQVRSSAERRPVGEVAEHDARRQRDDVLRELDDAEADDGLVFDLSSPVGGGSALGRLLKKLLSDARSPGGGPPGADTPTHWSGSGRRADTAALTPAPASASDDAPLLEQRGWTYPEWDVFRNSYRAGWCTVLEIDPRPEELAPFVPHGAQALRRPLARLGIGLDRCHRQLQGDDIDIDAAVEARVEAKAGSAPAEGVYVDSLRRRRDLAVLVLLDVSGSAAEPSATAARVHEHQRAAAGALSLALHDIGDRVALYAFRSQGRSAVHVVPVKRFGHQLDTMALRRLGGLVPGAYTRLGAAIRHGASVLEHEGGTSRRLLVVLSDGFAYDHGYEGVYAEADARRALTEARRRGNGCLCVSIGAVTDWEALQRVFGTAAHAAIPRVEHLAGTVGPLFRSALRSAEMQRRVWQRMERAREWRQIERTRIAT
ncbi:MAG TPA: VWA domain-containing protein [Acidimicrobiia bacterium]|nr:VWA domain-containing protein [Acidimicrobiia bacterium]